jgi:hypothetical protein
MSVNPIQGDHEEPQMNMRKALFAAIAGSALALGGNTALAVECNTLNTVQDWADAGSCDQADKTWTFVDASTVAGSDIFAAQILFTNPGVSTHVMQLVGFDDSDAAGSWTLDYTITVNVLDRVISEMYAGADNPGGGSNLDKDVTGDEAFSLAVVNGVEDAGSEKLGLNAVTLNVHEAWQVDANADLVSISNTYRQRDRETPEPATLALLGLGFAGFGLARRRKAS